MQNVPPPPGRGSKASWLVDALYHGRARTRSELADLLGLHQTTTSRLVGRLVEKGLIRSTNLLPTSSQGGRPSEELTLNPEVGVCIGLDFGRDSLTVAVTDAVGNLLYREASTRTPSFEGSDATALQLLTLAEEAVRNVPGRTGDILALGIALHGIVSASGEWMIDGAPHHPSFNLQAALQERVTYPVVTEDVSRAFAEAEHRFGAAVGHRDVIYLFLGSQGVGGGIFVNGRLLTSSNGVCGEIGHLRVVENGLVCQCGSRGCLETVASHQAIRRAVEEMIDRGVPSELAGRDGYSVVDVVRAARNDDKASFLVVKKLASYLARALASTISICGATRIVIGGQMREAGPEFLADVRGELRQLVIPALMRDITVQYAQLPNHAGAWGVALQAQRYAWLSGSVLHSVEVSMS